MRKKMASKILIFFLFFLLSSCGKDSPLISRHWPDCWPEGRGLNYPGQMKTPVMEAVCRFVQDNGLRYIHHSDYRPPRPGQKRTSQHNHGKALDFRVSEYRGMNQSEKLAQFYDDYLLMHDWLLANSLAHKISFGIYPDQKNPFFHWDTGERWTRWARIGNKYTTLKEGIRWTLDRF